MSARRFTLALLAFVAVVSAPARAHAQVEAHLAKVPGITTFNTYKDKYVWVTVYDDLKTRHLDYGCVAPKQARKWTNREIQNSYFTRFYVRGQVMETSDCKGTEYCDTTGEIIGANDIYINTNPDVKDPKKQCYWDKYDRSKK